MRTWRRSSAVVAIAVLLGLPGCASPDVTPPEAAAPAREMVEEPEAVEEPDGPDEPGHPPADGPAKAEDEPRSEEPSSEQTTTPDTSGQGATLTDLEDGRHPVYLVELDVDGRALTVDVIQFLTGEEAIAAYREDTPEDPEGDPPNDYHIRNTNPALRTLPVAEHAAVTVIRLGEPSGAEPVPSSFEALPAHLEGAAAPTGRLAWNPYWLSVESGEVVAIDEQYLP